MRVAYYAVNIFAIALILAACGSEASPVATVSTSVPIVTPPAPTVIATSQPTSAPRATHAPNEDVIPAPLYAITNGQIVRIERDGTTITPITHEPSDVGLRAVVSVAVSPKDNALAYLMQKLDGRMALIRNDGEGQNRVVLLDNLAAGTANSPLWSPDGAAIAIAVNGGDSTATIDDGIYIVRSGGIEDGQPKHLYPPAQQAAGTERDPNALSYTPVAFSPDGSKLLVSHYGQLGMCTLAILPVAGGDLREVKLSDESASIPCGLAAWSSDSSAVYTSFLSVNGPLVSNTGIWRVDAVTGKATILVPGMTNGKHVLVHTLATTHNATLNALVRRVDTVPAYGETAGFTYQWARVDATNGSLTIVRPETYTYDAQSIWSPNDKGMLVQTTDDAGLSTLTWTHQDGGAPSVIANVADLSDVEWGQQ